MAVDLTHARRIALDALVEHFAADHLRAEEFERRVAAARAATHPDELRALLVDLPGRAGGPGAGDAPAG